MFKRLFFSQTYIHELANGASRLTYLAGHYYHVAEEFVEELVAKGVAEVEGDREARLKAEADAAAEKAAAAEQPAPAEAEQDITHGEHTGGEMTESGSVAAPAPPE